jgi:hypothetical protein
MKDRLIGMMGTLGLVLVFYAAMPTTGAYAFGGSGGGGGDCGGTGCASVGAGLELRCDPNQPAGACTGQGCSCTSGRAPNGNGSCGCIK